MKIDFTKEPTKGIRQQMREFEKKMFTATEEGADINSVMLYSPLIQMLNNELTGRFVKRTTLLALGIACLSLVVSSVAFYVSSTSSTWDPMSERYPGVLEAPVVSSPECAK